MARHKAVDAAKAKVTAHYFPEGAGAGLRQAARRRRVQGAGSQDRPLEHPRHRQAHRRPRPQDRAPDRVGSRHPAAHPRLGAVHPRRDPGAGGRHARHRRGRAVHRRAARDLQGVASCCTTTSRPISVGETGRMGGTEPPRDRPRQARLARHPSDAAATSTSSPTRSASSRRSPSRTARPRWRPSAAPRSR